MDKNEAIEIINLLKVLIPNPVCELNYTNHYQLLVSVMLSAQTTDKAVNKVTKELFDKYIDFYHLSTANVNDIIKIIKPIGMSKVKSNNLISISKDIINNFSGKVPSDYNLLTSLRGIGRKTANVVLSLGYNIPTFPVDTHVLRIAYRLMFTNNNFNPLLVERDLQENINKELWIETHHLFLHFGRYYCKAINPKCSNCILKSYCRIFKKIKYSFFIQF